MAFDPQGSGANNADLRGKEGGANDERASSSSSSSHGGENTPPPTQQMDRQPSSVGTHDDGRIPAAAFERDPSEANKDWSMMSTDSVFALQVAPSCDFTGYFLAHPELMDMSTPPRSSTDAALAPLQFESIPELGDATMNVSYSFAFPNLIEDKRNCSKKAQAHEEQPPSPSPAAATATTTTEMAEVVPAEAETSNKPEAAPGNAAANGGLLPCFPCCSS